MTDSPGLSESPQRILVVEDDPDIREIIRLHLEEAQYRVTAAADGTQALARYGSEPFALVILDLGLPGVDGLEICRALAAHAPRPYILIITARSSEQDRVRGLDLGADDYLVKPFGTLELLARVRALLRRPAYTTALPEDPSERIVRAGTLALDLWERTGTINGRPIEQLTPREFDLLLWFARHPRRVYSRSELLDAVWSHGYDGYEHTVNSHLNRLRSKIERDPSRPAILVTVRGGGYKLVPPEGT